MKNKEIVKLMKLVIERHELNKLAEKEEDNMDEENPYAGGEGWVSESREKVDKIDVEISIMIE